MCIYYAQGEPPAQDSGQITEGQSHHCLCLKHGVNKKKMLGCRLQADQCQLLALGGIRSMSKKEGLQNVGAAADT